VRAARRREVGGNDALHIRNSVADTCPFHCFTPRSPQFPIQVIARATRPRYTKGGSVPKIQLERFVPVRLRNILPLSHLSMDGNTRSFRTTPKDLAFYAPT
jgi:hypothetical protein